MANEVRKPFSNQEMVILYVWECLHVYSLKARSDSQMDEHTNVHNNQMLCFKKSDWLVASHWNP